MAAAARGRSTGRHRDTRQDRSLTGGIATARATCAALEARHPDARRRRAGARRGRAGLIRPAAVVERFGPRHAHCRTAALDRRAARRRGLRRRAGARRSRGHHPPARPRARPARGSSASPLGRRAASAVADIPLLYETGPRPRLRRGDRHQLPGEPAVARVIERDGLTDGEAEPAHRRAAADRREGAARGLRDRHRRHVRRHRTARSIASSRSCSSCRRSRTVGTPLRAPVPTPKQARDGGCDVASRSGRWNQR